MLDVLKVQAQVNEKLQLLIMEANKYPKLSETLVEEFENLVSANFKFEASDIRFLVRRFGELLIPMEAKSHPPPLSEDSLNEHWAEKVLKDSYIIGVDTSEIKPTPHLIPMFLLVNVGYQAFIYGDKISNVHGSSPFFYTSNELVRGELGRGIPSWILEVKRLENELKVILNLNSILNSSSNSKFALFDESFSVGYLASRSKSFRRRVIDALISLQASLRDVGIIPVGIFYTRSRGFVVSLIKSRLCKNKRCSECVSSLSKPLCLNLSLVRDQILLDSTLNLGFRSQIFKVFNRLSLSSDIPEVYGFYLKVGLNNVFRVEFPSWCLDYVDDIHRIVLAQSIIGRGYPYVLERAHEEALISSRERLWVLNYLDRVLKKTEGFGLTLSGKFKRKIIGVV
ncbi:MAG: DNA double-strand break repair nuclease NurA [archaeon GB-1845-036]|nr:DNA double-strand break repair nuclease NurA [Candidatus Culexmicrobium thermophilum]